MWWVGVVVASGSYEIVVHVCLSVVLPQSDIDGSVLSLI